MLNRFNARGNVYRNKRAYQRAIADYDQAIRLNPNEPVYFMNRAKTFRYLRQQERAVADYRRALTLKSDESTRKQIETALKELGVKA